MYISKKLSRLHYIIYLYISKIHIVYIYIYVCMCVCVCDPGKQLIIERFVLDQYH